MPDGLQEDPDEWVGYLGHGMCLLSNEDDLNDINIVLFGGLNCKPLAKSFINININIKGNIDNLKHDEDNENIPNNVQFEQNQINVKLTKDIKFFGKESLGTFGWEIIDVINQITGKKERFIVIIGGWCKRKQADILIWNIESNEMTSIFRHRSNNPPPVLENVCIYTYI